jgi:hypothetical protein
MRLREFLVLLLCAMTAAVASSTAGAAGPTIVRVPLEGLLFNPCGELLLMTGEQQLVLQERTLRDGTTTFNGHSTWLDASAVGVETGIQYRLAQATHDTSRVAAAEGGSGLAVLTNTSTVMMVGQGAAPDVAIQATFHVTITPAGEVTAVVSEFKVECRSSL